MRIKDGELSETVIGIIRQNFIRIVLLRFIR